MSIDRWMDKQHAVYTYVEYYSAFKREVILSHAVAWMNHEDTLHDISPSQKDKSRMRPLVRDLESSNS